MFWLSMAALSGAIVFLAGCEEPVDRNQPKGSERVLVKTLTGGGTQVLYLISDGSVRWK